MEITDFCRLSFFDRSVRMRRIATFSICSVKRLLTLAAFVSLCFVGVSQAQTQAPKPPAANQSNAPTAMGEIPATVIAQLQLSPEQKLKLDAALDARRIMWSANRKSRQAEYAGLTELLNKNAFDPREAVVLRKKTRAAMDARIDAVQEKWLVFWDVLNEGQRKVLVAYMKEQHIKQGTASQARGNAKAAADAESERGAKDPSRTR
jgi:Spy/CpxP family protein refolding chaperone